MSLRLYEIPAEFQALEILLEASAGELTPEIEQAWAAIQAQGEAKVEATACVLKSMKAESEALAAESSRLDSRREALDKSQERIKALLLPALEALGGKVKTPKFTIYTQERETVAVELAPGYDIWALPEKFYRTREPELAKQAIKDAIKAGEEMPPELIVVKGSTKYAVIR